MIPLFFVSWWFYEKFLIRFRFQPASPEQLLDAFHALDTEGRGYLTREQITTLMTQDGEPFTQDELDEMLEIAIDPHTQTVPYEYYINQLMVSDFLFIIWRSAHT